MEYEGPGGETSVQEPVEMKLVELDDYALLDERPVAMMDRRRNFY